MFYNDSARRELAIETLAVMRRKGLTPLSKVPHFGIPSLDDLSPQDMSSADGSNMGSSSAVSDGGKEGISVGSALLIPDKMEEEQGKEESKEAYVIRTCRYCQVAAQSGAQVLRNEHLLHCDGIWLHGN